MTRLKQSIELYDGKCVITGKTIKKCLDTAHIKGVAECKTLKEKSDVYITLLLKKELHVFFDDYDISINPATKQVCVRKSCEDYEYLKKYDGKKLEISDKSNKYLSWHFNKFIALE